jgi:hypothetical protein
MRLPNRVVVAEDPRKGKGKGKRNITLDLKRERAAKRDRVRNSRDWKLELVCYLTTLP